MARRSSAIDVLRRRRFFVLVCVLDALLLSRAGEWNGKGCCAGLPAPAAAFRPSSCGVHGLKGEHHMAG